MLMEKQQTPAWINRAAEEISDENGGLNHYDYAKVEFHYQIAAIIAAHAPTVTPLEWTQHFARTRHFAGKTAYYLARCPIGNYEVFELRGRFAVRFETELLVEYSCSSAEEAKAAAYADYCKRIAACYGEAPK